MSESDSSSNHSDRVLRSSCVVRVRYAETDAMGWVYYACYFQYFEVARSELIREHWKSYRAIEEEDGLRLPVVEARCNYVSGARYEDELQLLTTMRVHGARLRFTYNVTLLGSEAKVADGLTVHCFASHDGKPRRVPLNFIRLLEK
ncbi:MAG: acyl-CoA thioesterase [Calditrichaeota bacterium]|nr:acyl-CoA thioesterase [Calditrichota bacterium]MCB9391168.1 acyl-CoA thioesterase [Calditrichota bacterium]